MTGLSNYISRFNLLFGGWDKEHPWHLTQKLEDILREKMRSLGSDYKIIKDVAIHNTASIDSHAILKGPVIISPHCFVGAHAYLRGGVFLDKNVSVGPACEIKSSLLFSHSALGHFNFVGDSLVGSHVNLEAGAVVANHYNERKDKNITVFIGGQAYSTGVEKFGALIGDHTRIGANAVLSPGSILPPDSIVKRLELIDQNHLSAGS
jgi:bifunctional N-acetylglucosamine-1-phosphate-uridyltransferase/glucosamine-1-phosphate-acetyltransferase GlmU-like protein